MSNLTKNTKLNAWLDEMIALTNPANVVLIDGTDEQAEALRAEACASGELFKLNQEKLPGCYLHRTAVNDVARVENRTFICTTKKEDAGPTNNWMVPEGVLRQCSPRSSATPTPARRCTSSPTRWALSAARSPRTALS